MRYGKGVARDKDGVLVNRKQRRAAASKKARVYNSVIDAEVVPHHNRFAKPIGYDVENGIATPKFRDIDLVVRYTHATKGRRVVPQVLVKNTYNRGGVRV